MKESEKSLTDLLTAFVRRNHPSTAVRLEVNKKAKARTIWDSALGYIDLERG